MIGKTNAVKRTKKKTRQGNSKLSKSGQPGTHGGNKTYKKSYRGQGKN